MVHICTEMIPYLDRNLRDRSVSPDNPHTACSSVSHWCMQTQRWHRSWETKEQNEALVAKGCVTSNLHDDKIMCFLREEGVSGVLGGDSAGRLGFDADRVSADLTRESLQQLKDGLHIALLWRVITVQPPRSTLIRHWGEITNGHVLVKNVFLRREGHCSYSIFILDFGLKPLHLLDKLLIHFLLKHFNCLITID